MLNETITQIPLRIQTIDKQVLFVQLGRFTVPSSSTFIIEVLIYYNRQIYRVVKCFYWFSHYAKKL